MKLMDYIELVEWSGRQIQNKKKGAIAATLPPILNRLGIESDNWLFLCAIKATMDSGPMEL